MGKDRWEAGSRPVYRVLRIKGVFSFIAVHFWVVFKQTLFDYFRPRKLVFFIGFILKYVSRIYQNYGYIRIFMQSSLLSLTFLRVSRSMILRMVTAIRVIVFI